MSEDFPEPMTQLAENAVQLHEMYLSYVEAGFRDDQAFDLVKTVLIVTLENTQIDDDDDD